MAGALADLSPIIAFAAIAVGGLVLMSTRSVAVALPALLELLLAAGLLRLSATATWPAIATAAAIVVVRKLAGLGITRSGASDAPSATSPAR